MSEARIDATPREALGRAARSLPFGGGCAIAIGGLLLGMGVLFGLGIGLVVAFGADLHEAKWRILPAVLFMCLVGAGLVRVGIRDQQRAARGKRLAALHPDQPWFADWAWDPQGTPAESEWNGTTQFVTLFVLLIAAPFNILWVYMFDPSVEPTMRLFCLMVLIPDFFMFIVGKGLVALALERIRYGRPHLAFDVFPFPLGGRMRARVSARKFAGQRGVSLTLRCIDERMVSRRQAGGGSSDSVQPYQLVAVRWIFPDAFSGQDVPLEVPLPDQPSTELLRQPPRYWELEIFGNEPGDTVRFTVPVYAC